MVAMEGKLVGRVAMTATLGDGADRRSSGRAGAGEPPTVVRSNDQGYATDEPPPVIRRQEAGVPVPGMRVPQNGFSLFGNATYFLSTNRTK